MADNTNSLKCQPAVLSNNEPAAVEKKFSVQPPIKAEGSESDADMPSKNFRLKRKPTDNSSASLSKKAPEQLKKKRFLAAAVEDDGSENDEDTPSKKRRYKRKSIDNAPAILGQKAHVAVEKKRSDSAPVEDNGSESDEDMPTKKRRRTCKLANDKFTAPSDSHKSDHVAARATPNKSKEQKIISEDEMHQSMKDRAYTTSYTHQQKVAFIRKHLPQRLGWAIPSTTKFRVHTLIGTWHTKVYVVKHNLQESIAKNKVSPPWIVPDKAALYPKYEGLHAEKKPMKPDQVLDKKRKATYESSTAQSALKRARIDSARPRGSCADHALPSPIGAQRSAGRAAETTEGDTTASSQVAKPHGNLGKASNAPPKVMAGHTAVKVTEQGGGMKKKKTSTSPPMPIPGRPAIEIAEQENRDARRLKATEAERAEMDARRVKAIEAETAGIAARVADLETGIDIDHDTVPPSFNDSSVLGLIKSKKGGN